MQSNARWYVIYTKPNEEDRVCQNLAAFNVETFSPKHRKKQVNQFTGKAVLFARPLFPRYLFARFDVDRMLHNISYVRGVQKVVGFNGMALPVDDEIIELIQSRTGEDGFVRFDDELTAGDDVSINDGAMRGINGIFSRTMADESRVMILLNAVNFQATLIVERELVQKATPVYAA